MFGNVKIGAVIVLLATGIAGAQTEYLLVVDSRSTTGRRVALFDPQDGTLIDPWFIDLNALDGGTPKHALQVGNEIWVSDQIRNRIDRFDERGVFVGRIDEAEPGVPLSNIRGMGVVNDRVFLTNAGTTGGAPGNALIIYDLDGNHLRTAPTAPHTSPFGVLHYGNDVLVSFSSAADIQRYDADGTNTGVFHVGEIAFAQQMNVKGSNGNVIVGGFSSPAGVYEYDPQGAQVGFIPGGGARAAYELGNGNIMWTNSSGVNIYDVGTGVSTTVHDANGQYIELFRPDAPCYPDCDGNGMLDFFDFLCFQNAFLAQDPYADCDQNGVFDFFDYLCFQNEFLAGCP
jgi:hypothetical protein